MIYLYRPRPDGSADIATAEYEASAARLEQRGYTRCSPALHRVVWQQQDRQAYRALLRAATRRQQLAWRVGSVMVTLKARGWKV